MPRKKRRVSISVETNISVDIVMGAKGKLQSSASDIVTGGGAVDTEETKAGGKMTSKSSKNPTKLLKSQKERRRNKSGGYRKKATHDSFSIYIYKVLKQVYKKLKTYCRNLENLNDSCP